MRTSQAASYAPPSQALARAREIADQVLAKPAAAVRMCKESINAVATALDHVSGYAAHDQLALSAASAEAREARQFRQLARRNKAESDRQ